MKVAEVAADETHSLLITAPVGKKQRFWEENKIQS